MRLGYLVEFLMLSRLGGEGKECEAGFLILREETIAAMASSNYQILGRFLII
jgi:hypothetical protein